MIVYIYPYIYPPLYEYAAYFRTLWPSDRMKNCHSDIPSMYMCVYVLCIYICVLCIYVYVYVCIYHIVVYIPTI
mgnify:CR=1 FL=1